MSEPPFEACPYPALPPPVRVRLVTTPEHPCPYLPGKMATNRAFHAQAMSPQVYQGLMDAGFRRSGRFVYQPVCRGCRACLPIRVPVETFRPSKSQRRCWRRNQDLTVEVAAPSATEEKFDLYRQYLELRHNDSTGDVESFIRFLYDSPVESLEFTYRDAGRRLLGVGITDLSPVSLSSVYFYFDPTEPRRGLGTFGALQEIAFAQRQGIAYYYIGFWVDGCRAMQYKQEFRPGEILHPDGVWRGQAESSTATRTVAPAPRGM